MHLRAHQRLHGEVQGPNQVAFVKCCQNGWLKVKTRLQQGHKFVNINYLARSDYATTLPEMVSYDLKIHMFSF